MVFLNTQSARLKRRISLLEKRNEKISQWRIGVFLTTAGAFLLLGASWTQTLTAIGAAVFAYLVFVQNKVRATQARFRQRLELAQKFEAIQTLDWANIPALPPIPALPSLPRYFSDLDLLSGQALLRLFNYTVSTAGMLKLISLFDSNGTSISEILRRQKVCDQLHRLRTLRRRFLVTDGLMSGAIESDSLLRLIANPLHSTHAIRAFFLIAFLQAVFIGSFVWFALSETRPYFLFAGLTLFGGYRLIRRHVQIVQAYGYGLSIDSSLAKFSALTHVLEKIAATKSAELHTLLAPFRAQRNSLSLLAKTSRVVGYLGVRQNPLLHLGVNLAVPWDFFWTLRLESLRLRIEKELPVWLDTLAEFEAFVSLAEFRACYPQYVFAHPVQNSAFSIRARGLSHPLIPDHKRIANDLELNPEQKCFIVTGSNMSGKSTFLRALGVNLLLAKAGSVTCAESFEFQSLDLATSLRLNDSLEDGLSSFYAEVKQLTRILNQAEAGHATLYLIDEVFRGTNNRERLIGSRAFIRRLAKTTSCGLITTHDLELSQLAEDNASIRCCHFKEDIEGDRMTFSYRLAPGPCPTTNALKVMELAGLPIC